MSQLLVAAGRYANILEHALLTSSSEDANCPLDHLAIGRPDMEFCFDAAAADDYVQADLSRLANLDGDFEESSIAARWTDGSVGASNAPTHETGSPYAGSQSLKLTLATAGAGNKAEVHQDITARSGQTWHVQAALEGDGTVTVGVRVQILETGEWVQDDGSLSTEADCLSRATASWALSSIVDFTLPTFAVCRRELLTLRIYAILEDASSAGVGYVDDLAIWPSWDFCSLHGVDLGPVSVQLRSSSDAFDADDQLVATMTANIPVMYEALDTPVTDRWAKLLFSGTNHTPISIGEWVLCLMDGFDSLEGPLADDDKFFDLVNEGPAGSRTPVRMGSDWPQRSLSIEFKHFSRTAQKALREEVSARTHGPAYPMVLCIPDESICLHGRKDGAFHVRIRTPYLSEETTLAVQESPFAPR